MAEEDARGVCEISASDPLNLPPQCQHKGKEGEKEAGERERKCNGTKRTNEKVMKE